MLRAMVSLPTPGKLFRRRMKGGGVFVILSLCVGFVIGIKRECAWFFICSATDNAFVWNFLVLCWY